MIEVLINIFVFLSDEVILDEELPVVLVVVEEGVLPDLHLVLLLVLISGPVIRNLKRYSLWIT